MNSVYMDNNATTSLKKEVLDAMMPYYTDIYGNASSKFYKKGRDAEQALYKLRESVAKSLNAKNVNEIYFTGSGCEADNWAIKGIALANKSKGNHIISIMTANNEIGTVEPIKEIAEIAKKHRVIFHTDAVQAIGHMKIDLQDLGVDLLSLSAHKFHGPKGVGMLYIRNGIRIDNLIHGGGQERGKRAATENLAGIAGLAKALELATENLDENIEHAKKMRNRLIEGIRKNIPYCRLNGPEDEGRLCNNVNFSFQYVEGESILMMLDMKGVAASSGSACASGSLDPSHVLIAIGLPHEIAHGSLRLSVGDETTEEDVDYVVEVLPPIIQRLRDMSPLYEGVERGDN